MNGERRTVQVFKGTPLDKQAGDVEGENELVERFSSPLLLEDFSLTFNNNALIIGLLNTNLCALKEVVCCRLNLVLTQSKPAF